LTKKIDFKLLHSFEGYQSVVNNRWSSQNNTKVFHLYESNRTGSEKCITHVRTQTNTMFQLLDRFESLYAESDGYCTCPGFSRPIRSDPCKWKTALNSLRKITDNLSSEKNRPNYDIPIDSLYGFLTPCYGSRHLR